MLLSQWLNAEGKPISPAEFQQWLIDKALSMYSKGWTVIGSYCKTPSLRPIQGSTRDQLLQWALEDIATCHANSLNLRLKDSNVIALDCDFHDPSLMAVFLEELSTLLGLHKRNFFTCKGAKGGKIFFKFSRQTIKDKPPIRLGAIAYSKGFAGVDIAKQELEVKTYFSTFAGLYGNTTQVNSAGQTYNDILVYSPLEGCAYIGDVGPEELQAISLRTIFAISDLYSSLLYKGGFVDANGSPIEPITHKATIIAAVAAYIVRLMLENSSQITFKQLVDKAALDPSFERLVVPYYRYLHLEEASNMIRRMFRGGPPVKPEHEAIIIGIMDALKERNYRHIYDLGGPFIPLTRRFNERLVQEAQTYGLIVESNSLPPFELFELVASHKGGALK